MHSVNPDLLRQPSVSRNLSGSNFLGMEWHSHKDILQAGYPGAELTDGDQPVGTVLFCLPITQGPLSLPLQPWASSARMSTWRSRGSRGSSRESTSAAPPTMSQRPSSSESKSPSTVSPGGHQGTGLGLELERVTMLPHKGVAFGSDAHKGPGARQATAVFLSRWCFALFSPSFQAPFFPTTSSSAVSINLGFLPMERCCADNL